MQPLNLPPIEAKTKMSDAGRQLIWDALRRRYVALTPEEWVRQHFVQLLTRQLHYPAMLIGNEVAVSVNGMSRRCDTVIYRRDLSPHVIVEYKAPYVEITEKVFSQIAAYNWALHASYLMVSNGLVHYCCHIDYAAGSYSFLRELPDYRELK